MKEKWALIGGLAATLLSAASLNAQTTPISGQLLFQETFQGYDLSGGPATPGTVGDGTGPWASAVHTGSGSWSIVQDTSNAFLQGTDYRYLSVTSTNNLSLTTPLLNGQEVVTVGFDYINRFVDGVDGSRWSSMFLRSGDDLAHATQLNNGNRRIRRTDGVTGAFYTPNNTTPVRIVTVMNNSENTITYDRLDGSGTVTLSSGMAAIWRHDYASGTWSFLIEEYIEGRSAGATLGGVIDSVRFELDGNAFLRSFDIGNIEVYAIPEPSTYALLFGLGALGIALALRRRRR